MNFLTEFLVFTCLLYSSAFVSSPNKGLPDPNKENNQLQVIVDAIKGLQTSVNASGKYMQSLGTKVYDLEKQLFIIQREQSAYEKRSEARFLKLENSLSKKQNKVEPLVKFSGETSSGYVGVTCPSGYKLLSCSCVGNPYCRGAYSHSDGTCYAHPNSRAASALAVIRARVSCGTASTVGDLKYVNTFTGGYLTNPSVSCPTDYTMIDCSILTDYGDKYTEIPLGIISGGRCMSSFTCRDDSKCYAYAICQKL